MNTPRRLYLSLAVVTACQLHAQSTGRGTTVIAAPPQVPPITTVAQILTLSTQPKGYLIDHQEVWNVLKPLPAGQRKQVLQQLIAGANIGLASSAAHWAVMENDVDLAPVIASRITAWPEAVQAAVVDSLSLVRDAYMAVPRQILLAAINSAKVTEPKSPGSDAVGIASVILAKSGTPADRQMVLSATQFRPKSWGIWMAIAYAGAMDAPRVAVASAVYKDTSATMSVRAAAAAALEPFDTQAAAFAVSQAKSLLSRFAGQDAGQIMYLGEKAKPGDAAAQDDIDFTEGFYQVAALLVMKDPAAHDLTFQYLNAHNQFISRFCHTMAAVRWPDERIKLGQGALSSQEYARVLAIIAIYNPQQAGAAAAQIAPDSMAKAKTDVAKLGLAALGMPVSMLKVF